MHRLYTDRCLTAARAHHGDMTRGSRLREKRKPLLVITTLVPYWLELHWLSVFLVTACAFATSTAPQVGETVRKSRTMPRNCPKIHTSRFGTFNVFAAKMAIQVCFFREVLHQLLVLAFLRGLRVDRVLGSEASHDHNRREHHETTDVVVSFLPFYGAAFVDESLSAGAIGAVISGLCFLISACWSCQARKATMHVAIHAGWSLWCIVTHSARRAAPAPVRAQHN